jgi:phage terminase small subunit
MTSHSIRHPDGLTDKQHRFVAEYLLTLNATDAARKAGYKQPNVTSAKLMANPLIAKQIDAAQRRGLEKLELSRDALLRELSCCALRDVADLCDERGTIITDDLRKLPESVRRCIDGIKQRVTTDQNGNRTVTTELKLSPKIAAVELAMKHFGMLKPVEHSVRVQVDWDKLYRDHSTVTSCDSIEDRIRNLSQQCAEAS